VPDVQVLSLTATMPMLSASANMASPLSTADMLYLSAVGPVLPTTSGAYTSAPGVMLPKLRFVYSSCPVWLSSLRLMLAVENAAELAGPPDVKISTAAVVPSATTTTAARSQRNSLNASSFTDWNLTVALCY
jgi:hypothetical protein